MEGHRSGGYIPWDKSPRVHIDGEVGLDVGSYIPGASRSQRVGRHSPAARDWSSEHVVRQFSPLSVAGEGD